MKRCLIALSLILFCETTGFPQLKYPCDSIPVILRAGAKAVIRSNQEKITYLSDKRSFIEIKSVITLLNDNAADLCNIEIPYDESQLVTGIRAYAYNETGKLVWTLKSYDIWDLRDFSGPENLSDDRKKAFEIPLHNFPFTIEYSYSVSIRDEYINPQKYLQTDPEVSVEESGIQYVIPDYMRFNYKALNLKNPTDSNMRKGNLYLTWKEENIRAQRQRYYAPPLIKSLPVVYGTPLHFSMKGHPGSFESWQSYGKWVAKLIEGRDALDEAYAVKARSLVSTITARKDKIKALYEYMQQHTRYFYIGFGIGGNQPIPANEVAKNGYGDCKALSNYMKALLKTVDIESYYTLVQAHPGHDIEPDFPSDQFDHIILCVPNERDTIWLECTDQTNPFNYLGSFTCDRYVLAVTPEGGKLLHTPKYNKDFNLTHTYSEIALFGTGDADIKMKWDLSGLMYDDLFAVSEEKPDARRNWLAGQIGQTAIEVKNEGYSRAKNSPIPVMKASFDIHVRDLSAKSLNRLYVKPALVNGLSYLLDDPEEIYLDIDYRQNDSVRIEIPLGYQPEFLPENKQFTTRFGSYSRSLTHDGKYIYFSRKMEINEARYPKETYPEFYNFVNDIATNDHQMLILKAKN